MEGDTTWVVRSSRLKHQGPPLAIDTRGSINLTFDFSGTPKSVRLRVLPVYILSGGFSGYAENLVAVARGAK
jgi:hypothetical protein